MNNTILLKREDFTAGVLVQTARPYNKMAKLTPEQRQRGVIAASPATTRQGVALSAQRLGCEATIVMPVTTRR